MRKAPLILAALLVISVIVSANLWRELRTERSLTADLQVQLADTKGLLSRAAASAAPTAADTSAVVPAVAATPDSGHEMPPERPPPATVDQVARGQRIDPLTDPEYRKARLIQQRLMTSRSLPGLAEELGLSDEEAARLVDLLAENRLNVESALRMTVGADGQLDPEGNLRRQQTLRREQEESVAALLGTGKYAQWQQYQKTLRHRQEAFSMGAQLAQVGQPLTSAQQKSLAAALIAEDERTREQREALVRRANATDPQSMAELQQEGMRLREEADRRILEAVGSSLDARQLETLRSQFEAKTAMDRAASGLQRPR